MGIVAPPQRAKISPHTIDIFTIVEDDEGYQKVSKGIKTHNLNDNDNVNDNENENKNNNELTPSTEFKNSTYYDIDDDDLPF